MQDLEDFERVCGVWPEAIRLAFASPAATEGAAGRPIYEIGTHIAGSTRSSHLRTSDEVIGEESRNPSHSDDEKVQRHPTLGRQRRRRVRTDLRHRVITLVKQSYAI